MMQHSTDYNGYASDLSMGDRFQLSQHDVIRTVAWADPSADGTVMHVRLSDGETVILNMFRRCHVIKCVHRCSCGRRYELCERDCDWPADLEALFYV